MPQSRHPFGMIIGNSFRVWCAKHIAKTVNKGIKVEKGASVQVGVVLNGSVGVNCEIGPDAVIGHSVMMAPDCQIITRNKKFNKEKKRFLGFEETKPVIIGDRCWLGSRVLIMPGVEIGEGCVVAAGAVVSKSMPPYHVVAGNPARPVKNLMED